MNKSLFFIYLLKTFSFMLLLNTLISCTNETQFNLDDSKISGANSKDTFEWKFDDSSLFTFPLNYTQLTSGQIQLKPVDKFFSGSDFSGTGFVGMKISDIDINGVQTPVLSLGNSSTCDGSITNCESLSADWTPN